MCRLRQPMFDVESGTCRIEGVATEENPFCLHRLDVRDRPPAAGRLSEVRADTRIESGEGLLVIRMPENYGALSPRLDVVPLQLQAYHTACARGTKVDKPRNLAKPVTVE
jgi:hypothetical protein